MDRKQLFAELWTAQDEAYDLMAEYDGIPHYYGEEVMYHAEGQIIDLIAEYEGITVTDIADITKKTPSASSQSVKKLKDRGLVEQIRNAENNRKYNLKLTADGWKIYDDRKIFNQKCQDIMWEMLNEFSEEELRQHIVIQKKINAAYRGDIKRSRERVQNTVK